MLVVPLVSLQHPSVVVAVQPDPPGPPQEPPGAPVKTLRPSGTALAATAHPAPSMYRMDNTGQSSGAIDRCCIDRHGGGGGGGGGGGRNVDVNRVAHWF